ncbi:hypothetical protein, partial [Pseudomonas sp. GW456-11-11-14-LB1]|uniref:hypothetical protein n=1 Tax=Pseudomonas sp. GW456-11-11-14-LB1 TaxID=2070667 RepID=UPI001C4480D5
IGIGSEVIPAPLVASYLSGYVNYHQSLISVPFLLVTPLTVLGYGAASSLLRKKLGPHLVSVSEAEGGFLGCVRRCEQLAASCPNVFL